MLFNGKQLLVETKRKKEKIEIRNGKKNRKVQEGPHATHEEDQKHENYTLQGVYFF